MKTIIAVVLFVFPLACGAQIYQCKDGAGKTTLQQAPCSGTGKMVVAPTEQGQQETVPRGRRVPAQSADERQLTALVAEALSRRDYPRAESLAVTAQHWDMISRAKLRDEENKRAAREETLRRRAAMREAQRHMELINSINQIRQSR